MFNATRSFPRALCALSLAAALAVVPAAAVQTQLSDPPVLPAASSSIPQPDAAKMPDSISNSSNYSKLGYYLRYSPKLLEKGYSQQEVDALFSSIPSTRIMALLRYPYIPQAAEYIAQPHFRSTALERYVRYGQSNPDLPPEQIVTQVNIGLDRESYTNIRLAQNPHSTDVLVNKYNYLSSTFKPELVQMGSRYASYTAYMEPTAYEWFTKMVDDAQKEGLWLYCVSAYRSYSYQRTLYQRYVNQSGKAAADTFSARPGYSEHQTGLAVDINVASSSAHFENTAQYRWLSENSWKYGFILRYPEGKQHITGFKFEPWHYRYVGQELAKAVYESGLTYDEYVASLPTGTPQLVLSLTYQDKSCTPERAPVLLNDTHYLKAGDLAAVFGLTCRVREDGSATLTGQNFHLVLTRDQTACQLNHTAAALTHTPFVQSGDLLLPLEDISAMMGLALSQEGDTLILSVPVEVPAEESTQTPTESAEIPAETT